MKTKRLFFHDWLKDQKKDPVFAKAFKAEDVRARLALRIAEVRQRKRLTQAELAKKLHTTQQAISDIESFKHQNITLGTLQKIAEALNSRLVVDLKPAA